jgi:hypothetical protein
MSAEAKIRAWLDSRIEAMRRKDAAAFALLAPDITAFEIVPPFVSHGAAARDDIDSSYRAARDPQP